MLAQNPDGTFGLVQTGQSAQPLMLAANGGLIGSPGILAGSQETAAAYRGLPLELMQQQVSGLRVASPAAGSPYVLVAPGVGMPLTSMASATAAGLQYQMLPQQQAVAAAYGLSGVTTSLSSLAGMSALNPYGLPLAQTATSVAKADQTAVDAGLTEKGAMVQCSSGSYPGVASPYQLVDLNSDENAALKSMYVGAGDAQLSAARLAASGSSGVGYYVLPAGYQSQLAGMAGVGGLGGVGVQMLTRGTAADPTQTYLTASPSLGYIPTNHSAVAQAFHPYRR